MWGLESGTSPFVYAHRNPNAGTERKLVNTKRIKV